jgi:NADPH-dependent 2,4-dienoyl-CoA reductase/sulfur reductase-like enzyme/bacterioferritin-associated ferredoxin
MRASYSENIELSNQIKFEFEGRIMYAFPGDSIAASLTSYGIINLRVTSSGDSRGIFCGMGVCHDCLVEVDGNQNQRACMTKVKDGMRIFKQKFFGNSQLKKSNQQEKNNVEIKVETPDILVIGGGVGGMSAARIAAESGLDVILIDDRVSLGGQFSKQPTPVHASTLFSKIDPQIKLGKKLIKQLESTDVKVLKGVQIWAGYAERNVLAIIEGRNILFSPRRLIIATGAYERPIPVEGWTLPGVMTTGAVQTLLRTYNVIAGKEIFIAGNGPFNIQVALELARAGASIVGISESSNKPGFKSLASIIEMFRSSPKLVFQGMQYIKDINKNKIPMYYNYNLSSVKKDGDRLKTTISTTSSINRLGQKDISFKSDIVCMGYGFLPSNILLRNLGCNHVYDTLRKQLVVERSNDFETNIAGVYAVGDCAGLGGAYAARDEGIIAGVHSVLSLGINITKKQENERSISRNELKKHRKFQSAFWKLYSIKIPNYLDIQQETYICRCELVTMGQIRKEIKLGCITIGEIKQRTRAGMGRCQGRYCASFLTEILKSETNAPIDEENFFAPRFPINPIKIHEITKL